MAQVAFCRWKQHVGNLEITLTGHCGATGIRRSFPIATAAAPIQTRKVRMKVLNSCTEAMQIPPDIRLTNKGKPTGCAMISQEKITDNGKGKVFRTDEFGLEFLQFYAESRILCQ